MALTPEQLDRLRALHAEGRRVAEIAAALELPYHQVYQTLVRLGLHQPRRRRGTQAPGDDAGPPCPPVAAYNAFVRSLQLAAIWCDEVRARLLAHPQPSDELGYRLTAHPLRRRPFPEGLALGFRYELAFLARDEDQERVFGIVHARWWAGYRTDQRPSRAVRERYVLTALPLHLWPYFRTQVDQLTAQMGLPRLTLPIFSAKVRRATSSPSRLEGERPSEQPAGDT